MFETFNHKNYSIFSSNGKYINKNYALLYPLLSKYKIKKCSFNFFSLEKKKQIY